MIQFFFRTDMFMYKELKKQKSEQRKQLAKLNISGLGKIIIPMNTREVTN